MTGTEVATRNAASGTLALAGNQGDWTDAQRAALAQIGVAEAPVGDQMVLLHVAQRTGLDPFARQIYMIGRNDRESGGKKWTIQTGIDGFRLISERHPQYAGCLDAEWCGEDGVWRDVWTAKTPPTAARFTVMRKDWEHPIRAVAHFDEYVQRKFNGDPTSMWATKPAHMISKVSEALARRRAFPQDLAAVYTDDEMAHVDNPPMVVIQAAEREQPAEPDWDTLIRQHETAGDRAKLGEVWRLARGLRPNDAALLDRIAQAGERLKAAEQQPPEQPHGERDPDTVPAEKSQRNRLFALLRDGAVSGSDRALRLRIVSRILNRPPAEPVTSFDALSAAEVGTVNDFLQRQKDDGVLVHTLADLGAAPADATGPTAEQPPVEAPTDTETDQP
ncbi:MAG: phage recombination protein Bet [Candidatus Dormibacteria bacterium]